MFVHCSRSTLSRGSTFCSNFCLRSFCVLFICIYSLDSGEYSTSFFSNRIAKQKISLETLGDDDQSHTHTDTLLVLVSVFPHYTQQQLSLDQSSSQWLCLFTIVVIFFFSSSSFFSFSFSLTAANHSIRVSVLVAGCQQTISSLVNQVSLSLSLSLEALVCFFCSLSLTLSINTCRLLLKKLQSCAAELSERKSPNDYYECGDTVR